MHTYLERQSEAYDNHCHTDTQEQNGDASDKNNYLFYPLTCTYTNALLDELSRTGEDCSIGGKL